MLPVLPQQGGAGESQHLQHGSALTNRSSVTAGLFSNNPFLQPFGASGGGGAAGGMGGFLWGQDSNKSGFFQVRTLTNSQKSDHHSNC